MNERIRELAEQAESSANEVFDFDGRGYYDIVMAKFAELIIEECCDYVRAIDAMEIKKHFGVEE